MKLRIFSLMLILMTLTMSCSVTINPSNSVFFVPRTHDFGSVIVNESVTKDFKIKNITSEYITITMFEITGADKNSYSIVGGGNVPLKLLGGQEHNILINFAPQSEGVHDVKLSATYNNGKSTTSATIMGIGTIEAIFEINPSSYDFNDVGIGATVEKTFTIFNKGNEPLKLNSISIEDDAEDNFNISDGLITSATDLYPGTTHEVTVTFSPATMGKKSAKLRVEHNLVNSPFDVPLAGNGSNEVSLSPDEHDFGEVEVGSESSDFTFTVTNPTASNVTLQRIEILGADAISFDAMPEGNLNVSIPQNGGSYEFKVKFKPTKSGNMNTTLKLTLSTGTLTANLFGEGITNPLIDVNPSSFNFGSVIVNSAITKIFTVSNNGSALLSLSSIQLQDNNSGSFSITKGGEQANINPGFTHEIEIQFKPATQGDKSANLIIVHDGVNAASPVQIPLNGKGSEISLQPSVHDFGDVNINPSPAPKQTFTVTNTSNVVVTITKIEIIGVNASDFNVTPSGDGSWAANPNGGTFTVDVTCNPLVEGTLSAVLQLTMSAGNPLQASLNANGVGNPIFQIYPTYLDFGTVDISADNTKKVVISNIGTGTLKLSEIAIIDDADNSYSIVSGGVALGTPVVNLLNGQNHEVSVKFAPLKHGAKTAKIHIAHNGSISSVPYFDVNLTGIGTGPEFELIPMGIAFDYGYQIVGKIHTECFYIRNNGDKNLLIPSIAKSGNDFELKSESTPIQISPGEISVVEVNFKPSTTGVRNGSVTFSHNSVGSPYTVTLTGTGIDGPIDYYTDFDGNSLPNGWGGSGDWEWGVPHNGPSSAHTRSKCWGTRLNAEYRDNQYCYVVSPVYDMSKMVAPKAEFWLWLDTVSFLDYYKDGVWMEISTDGGNTWTRDVKPTPAYNSTVSSSISAYVGVTTAGWEKITMNVGAAAGKSQVMFAWYFYSDNYLHSDGAFIDSFRIYDSGNLTPYNPTPVDNDINVKYTTSTFTLRWDCSNATSYDVYFGTANPPTTRIARAISNNYNNVSVSNDQKYYWKVVATNTIGTFNSPVWCFHTTSSMPKVLINEVDTIDSADWVEIYNAGTKAAHIGGWQFITYSDGNNTEDGIYRFQDYLVLNPGQAIVIHDNQASGETFITEFNFNWANATSAGEVILKCPENYDTGIDYIRFNTYNLHKPADLAWNGLLTSNYSNYSNFYRRYSTDTDNANDWRVRYRTNDKGFKNPGQ